MRSYRFLFLLFLGTLLAACSDLPARNDYRPGDAPDVAIIGFAGRCHLLECVPPYENRAYLSEAPMPDTLGTIADAFERQGHTTVTASFRSHFLDDPTYGPGYRAADDLLIHIRDNWIRDFKNPTQVVLVAHSHGNQFMSLLAWDHPEIQFAYGIYLDAICYAWDSDHEPWLTFEYGFQSNYPTPLDATGRACDSLLVPGLPPQDISDVVPWNITWGLEVWSDGVIWGGLVADWDRNHRPDGSIGLSAGLAGVYVEESHNYVHHEGSQGMKWVVETIRHNGLPPLPTSAQ